MVVVAAWLAVHGTVRYSIILLCMSRTTGVSEFDPTITTSRFTNMDRPVSIAPLASCGG